MSIAPARIFTDRYDDKCRITIEQNQDKLGPYALHGGVWLSIKNGNTGAIVAVDLTDEDAAQLGEFLREITARSLT